MEQSLIEIARKVISETCVGVDLSKHKPIYIPIKDNQITVSLNINSLKKADECMLLLPYRWDNTVPNRYGTGTVTFINTLRKLVSIDNEGDVYHYGYPKDSPLQIGCECTGFGSNVKIYLKYNGTTLYRNKHISPTVEDFHDIWNHYQASKKIMDIMVKDFEDERFELQSKLEEMTNKCSALKKKNKALKDSIKEIKGSSD